MKNITIQQRGTITLPKKIREELELIEGSSLRVSREGKKVVLEPLEEFDAQLMKDIREGLEDIKQGRYIEFSSIEEFDAKIKEHES